MKLRTIMAENTNEDVNVTTVEEPAAKKIPNEVNVIIKKPAMTIEGYEFYNCATPASNRETFVMFLGIPYAKPPIEKSKRFAVISIYLLLLYSKFPEIIFKFMFGNISSSKCIITRNLE